MGGESANKLLVPPVHCVINVHCVHTILIMPAVLNLLIYSVIDCKIVLTAFIFIACVIDIFVLLVFIAFIGFIAFIASLRVTSIQCAHCVQSAQCVQYVHRAYCVNCYYHPHLFSVLITFISL